MKCPQLGTNNHMGVSLMNVSVVSWNGVGGRFPQQVDTPLQWVCGPSKGIMTGKLSVKWLHCTSHTRHENFPFGRLPEPLGRCHFKSMRAKWTDCCWKQRVGISFSSARKKKYTELNDIFFAAMCYNSINRYINRFDRIEGGAYLLQRWLTLGFLCEFAEKKDFKTTQRHLKSKVVFSTLAVLLSMPSCLCVFVWRVFSNGPHSSSPLWICLF